MRGRRATAILLLVLSFSMSIGTVSSVMATEDYWVTKEPMQQARGNLGVAAVNGKVYAIGGFTIGGLYQPDFSKDGFVGTNEEYDPETNTWIFKKPMPTPRAGFGIAVYQNKIYCIGGRTNDGITGINEVYNPATDTWETKTAMPTARWMLKANIVKGRIYLVGGYPNATLNEVYDPATDTWVTETSMPTGVDGYASVVVDNRIHVIGGDVNGVTGTLHQIYDTENDSWSMGASIPERVTEGSAGATTGALSLTRIYVVGFRKLDGEGVNYIYDAENDNWVFGAGVPTSRLGMGVAAVNDTLYAVGGYIVQPLWNDVPVAVNEQYTPIGYGTPDPSYVPPDTVAPAVSVISPQNETNYKPDLPLIFTVNEPVSWARYKLDGETVVEVEGNSTLNGLSEGSHNLTLYVTDDGGNTGTSETVYFTVDNTAPTVSVLAPQNIKYDAEVPLNYTVSDEASKIYYSLDGQETIPITGNTTLSGLTGGLHNITVYAEDPAGNIGTSTATFTITKQELPLTTLVAVASAASVAAVAVALTLYFKKRKTSPKTRRF